MAASRPSAQTERRRALHRAILSLALVGMAFPPTGLHAQTMVQGPWGAGLGLEAFVGAIDFNSELRLEQQTLVGGLGGLKLGRDVSLLGYYWRGTTDNLGKVKGIESWGGEFQFDINFNWAVKPFILAGGGRIHFRDEFLDDLDLPRKDENVLVLGGGLAWDVNRWLRLTGTARDYLIEVPDVTIDEPGLPTASGSLVSSWMLTGGLQFRLGGQPERVPQPEWVPVGGFNGGSGGGMEGAALIPVPASGEIRVTYGDDAEFAPGGGTVVTADGDTISFGGSAAAISAVQRILETELGYLDALYPEYTSLAGGRQPITGERADTLERRMAWRMNEIFDYLMQVEADEVRVTLQRQLAAANVGTDATEQVMARADTVLQARLAAMEAESAEVDDEQTVARRQFETHKAQRRFAAPFLGANFSNGGQFLLGGRMAFNTTWQANRWAWVPEVTLGFGAGGVSTLVQGGLQYHFVNSKNWHAYTGLSAGLLVLSDPVGDRDGASFVVTPLLGVTGESAELSAGLGGGAWGWFAEYQAVGFFDLNRILVGLNWAY